MFVVPPVGAKGAHPLLQSLAFTTNVPPFTSISPEEIFTFAVLVVDNVPPDILTVPPSLRILWLVTLILPPLIFAVPPFNVIPLITSFNVPCLKLIVPELFQIGIPDTVKALVCPKLTVPPLFITK